MVDFTVVKCPRCGADLKSEQSESSFFCRYCGAQVLAEKKTHYIGEDPRRTALEKYRVMRVVEKEKLEDLQKKKEAIEKELATNESNLSSQKWKNGISWIIGLPFIGIGLFGVYGAIFALNDTGCFMMGLVPLTIGCFFILYYFIIGRNAYKTENVRINSEHRHTEYEIRLTKERISELEAKIMNC
jgi:DNA-directed RNA polymerase subunit RPC12/RpoP